MFWQTQFYKTSEPFLILSHNLSFIFNTLFVSGRALDRIDRNILNLLQTDGGLTNTQLAKQVHLSPSACNRRVQRLQADGIIEGRVALIRQELVGKPTNVFVEVSLDSQKNVMASHDDQVFHLPI